jgi:AcrR family transcriptional regulator
VGGVPPAVGVGTRDRGGGVVGAGWYLGRVPSVPLPEVRGTGDLERQELVVAAAMACFERWGVARTRMEDIAREAGIARTVLYRHFASKDALQQAVMVRHIERRAAELHREVPRRGASGPLILRALLTGIIGPPDDRVSESVLGAEVVHETAALVATSPAIAAAMHAYWEPYLRHAESRDELRAGVTVDDAVRWLTMIVFYFLTLPEVAPPPDRLEDHLRTFVVDAIVTPGSRPAR